MPKRFIVLIVGIMLLMPGVVKAQTQSEVQQKIARLANAPDGITIMTRNIYIGGDVDKVIGADDPNQIPFLAAEVFNEMISTNFPERAQALADEIAWAKPHLIGIQESTRILFQKDGDAVIGGTIQATEILYNYLAILRRAIAERDLDYTVAARVKNADVELPMVNPESLTGFSDVRVIDYDVILVRGDVEISNKTRGTYQTQLEVPGTFIIIPRGYVAVDATINGRTYRFVNTHLEPAVDLIKMAQAQELLLTLANETLPVILVGDFNSNAPRGETYQFIKTNGYVDAWRRNLLKEFRTYNKRGFTSGQDSDLRNEESTLNNRIDLIFIRTNIWRNRFHDVGPVLAAVVGDHPNDKTPSGLWPSDHAGVVLKIWIPEY